MVAPSFQSYTMLTPEPFAKGDKLYVTVRHPTTGNSRNVRWYTDTEYRRAYGGANKSKEEKDGFAGLAVARGFKQGPILLIRNWKPSDEAWLGHSVARYAVDVGWYIASTDQLPAEYPSHFRFLLLTWKEFSLDERHMKSQSELSKIIREKERRKEYVTF